MEKKKQDNVIEDKTFEFAVQIVKLSLNLEKKNKEYVISRQVLKSGTSIGANVSEAQYAQSKKDFISKMSIALKEASETRYWIKLLIAVDLITEEEYSGLFLEINSIIKILTAILNASKK